MTNQPPQLSSVIDRALSRQGATSYRELDRRSEQLGVHISHTTLSAMHNGRYRSEISRDMRQKLATLAGLKLGELDGLTGLSHGEPFVLPDSADTLTGEQRDAVLAVVRAFANANANSKGADSGNAAATTGASEQLAPVSRIRRPRTKRQTRVEGFDPLRSVAETHPLPDTVVDQSDGDGGEHA